MTWIISIDADDDFVFAETGESLADRVVSFETFIGFRDVIRRVADPCSAVLRVLNHDGLFSPEHASAGDVILGRFLAIYWDSYAVFTGVVRLVMADDLEPYATITCTGRTAGLANSIRFPVMRDVSSDEIIQVVLDRAELSRRLANTSGYYLVLDQGQLDVNYLAPAALHDVDLQVGIGQFEIVGTDYELVSALRVVEDAVNADWGWFFEAADGEIIFLNRHYSIAQKSVDATWSSLTALSYRMDIIGNEVIVGVSPVYLDEGVVLWQLQTDMRFRPGNHRRRVQFVGEDGRSVAVDVDSLMTPDWIFYDEVSNGIVADDVSLVVEPDATGAWLIVGNGGSEGDVFLLAGAQLVGDALRQDEPVQIFARAEASITRHGRKTVPVRLPGYADVSFATDLAEWLVDRYAAGFAYLLWVELPAFEQRALFDLVRVQVPSKNHDQDYLVVGIERRWTAGVLSTRYYLEPSSQYPYFVLDVSKLDEDYLAL